MPQPTPQFDVGFARTSDDILAAQQLRYHVFVSELCGQGSTVDHVRKIEADRYDRFSDHLILWDRARSENDQVVGVYRLMNDDQAVDAKSFSCESEYDISVLKAGNYRLLELSRSCLHPEYRGGTAMFHVWQALAAHIASRQVDILFGVASFHGTNLMEHAQGLTFLAREHQGDFNVPSRVPADIPQVTFDRKAALRATPALIKAYLRLGGVIGQGAFVDHDLNTTDVCMILEVAKMNARQKAIYSR